FGNDVISRISHTMQHEDGLNELRQSIAGGINEDLAEFEKRNGNIRKYIYDVVAVGNSTMRSILFGQDVNSLGVIPYEPANLKSIESKATDLVLEVNPSCRAYGGPLIGGHAGADAVADILACGMHQDDQINMLIDIGTNGEVAVGNSNRIMTASCAAGGAYEGATVKCGVGAIEGAIKNIWIHNGHVEFETIGNKPPLGICGSGLIDLLAELLRSGIMTRNARIEREFHVTDKISITQQDIYQLITAKAGLRCDQDLLMKYYGVGIDGIERIYLAGGFGNFINPENAAAIGLLPHAPEKTVRVGNAALAGAREMLLSREMRNVAERLAANIEHTKPNEREPDFAYIVADKMYF
ncbi:MAG: ASKHA domain-containing protein, partial [Planctomycetota bacterium]|nr:ASKHA domain-containing protein [Planctomycetota bacterium]